MRVRACLLLFPLTLVSGLRAEAGELDEPLRPVRVEAPVQSAWLDERLANDSRVLWGMGEWPMPMLEAERRSFGVRLEFQFGSGSEKRREPVR
jgi:hypothetical protein